MEQIPIKINTKEPDSHRPPRPTIASQNSKEKAVPPKSKRRWYLWLLLALVIIEAGVIAFLYLTNITSPFYQFIPTDSVSTIYFNQSSLVNLAKSLKNNQAGWAPFVMSEQYLSDFMAKNNLDMVEIGSLFEDKMALILLPTESSGKPQWLYLAVIKKSPAEVSPIIDDAEKNLKQNYNLISDVYRQIEITQIKPLDEDSIGVFFAQPGNLFILSNDNQTIKNTIDKALK